MTPFVAQMQALLDKITSARTDWERKEAEREMAEAIKQQSQRESAQPDFKQQQTGERE